MSGWIYYMKVGDLIKIGYAADVRKRMHGYPPKTMLLAVEPGTLETEAERLAYFEDLREWGNEWFRPGAELVEHISNVRRTFGIDPEMVYEYTHVSNRTVKRKQATTKPNPPASTVVPWLTIAEAAERISVSTKTIRRMIADGTLEARRMGKRLIRVDPSSLAVLGRPLQYVEHEWSA